MLWQFRIAAVFWATHFFLTAKQALSVACEGVERVRATRAAARASVMRGMIGALGLLDAMTKGSLSSEI